MKTDSRYSNAFNCSIMAMAFVTPELRYIELNDSFCALLGYSRDELLQLTTRDITHPADLEEDAVLVQQLRSGQINSYQREKRYVHKLGHDIWAIANVSLIVDDEGEPQYFISQIQDITRFKQEQFKLQKTTELYELISQNAQDVITYVTPDGIVRYISPAVKHLLGYEPAELIGLPVSDFYHPEDSVSLTSRTFADEDLFVCRIRHKNGSYIWFETTFKIIRDKNGHIEKTVGIGRNIHERRQMEEQLRKSEESLAHAQRIAHLGNFDWDLKADKIQWSDEMYRIYGITQAEARSFASRIKWVHPEDLPKLQRAIQDALDGGAYDLEYRIIRPDRRERILHAQADVMFDDNCVPVRMIGTVLDITERKRTELLLMERKRQYRLISENSIDIITRHLPDEGASYIFVSPASRRILGYEPEEMIGRSAFDFIHPEDSEAVRELHRTILDYNDAYTLTYRARRKDGSYIWMESTSRYVLNETTGEIQEVIAVSRDITDRKRHLEQIERLSYQNSLILNSVAEGIFGLDLQRRIIFCNQAAARMLAHDMEELIGKSPDESFWPGFLPESMMVGESGDAVVYQEDVFYKKGGTAFPVELTSTRMLDNGNVVGAVVNFTDITERKQTEQLREERKLLEVEFELAASIQQYLLPQVEDVKLPAGADVGVRSVPARKLNGDFYNFAAKEDEFLFGIADVSGKGIPASVLMSMMKFAMDEMLQTSTHPETVLDVLNRFVDKNTNLSTFVSMFIGSYNQESSTFYYASAGHEPAILYRTSTGEFLQLTTDGAVLGLSRSSEFTTKSIDLEPGDMILLYTDGVIENKDKPEPDDNQLLLTLLRETDLSLTSQEIVDSLYERIKLLNDNEAVDDQTLLLFRI